MKPQTIEQEEITIKPKELIIIKGELLSSNDGCNLYIFSV